MKSSVTGKISLLAIAMLSQLLLIHCKNQLSADNKWEIEVKNTADVSFNETVISVPANVFVADSVTDALPDIVIKDGDKILTSEFISINGLNHLLIQCDVPPMQTKVLKAESILPGAEHPKFEKKTQAEIAVKEGGDWKWITKKNGNEQYEYQGGDFKNIEYLKVPEQHTDHSFYIKYEGPGWESDKVAYRFYLDWRNAVDIFGKKVPGNVLQQVGLDGFDSYHEPAEWGMDVFKVGKSLGIGSIGYWNGEKAIRVEKTDSVTCKVALNGILRSAIETQYYGWQTEERKLDLSSRISIDAGSRLSYQELKIDGEAPLLCTGIIKHKNIGYETNFGNENDKWVYVSTYGKQSLAGDSLGLAVLAERKYVKEITNDPKNHVMVLQAIDNKVSYYFLAAWEQETDGIKNDKEFNIYMKQLVEQLSNPVEISATRKEAK